MSLDVDKPAWILFRSLPKELLEWGFGPRQKRAPHLRVGQANSDADIERLWRPTTKPCFHLFFLLGIARFGEHVLHVQEGMIEGFWCARPVHSEPWSTHQLEAGSVTMPVNFRWRVSNVCSDVSSILNESTSEFPPRSTAPIKHTVRTDNLRNITGLNLPPALFVPCLSIRRFNRCWPSGTNNSRLRWTDHARVEPFNKMIE